MEPPWVKFPAIGLGSLGWRMGAGDEYWFAFQDWFGEQAAETQASVRAAYPEPERWEGFYERSLASYKALRPSALSKQR